MKEILRNYLMLQSKPYIQENDLIIALESAKENSRYSLIKRAKKSGWITPLKKGFYIINKPFTKEKPNLFEIAGLLYGPSHISFLSALSYHHWIPKAEYTITSVTALRNK